MAVLGSCHEFFSLSKRKFSRGEFPYLGVGGLGRGMGYEDFLFDEVKNLIETSIEYHFEIFPLVTPVSPPPLP